MIPAANPEQAEFVLRHIKAITTDHFPDTGEMVLPMDGKRGVSVDELSFRTGISPRNLRACIKYLRERGEPICGRPSTGYFYATSADDLADTLAFLRARAMSSLLQISRLSKTAMPELMGQLKLEFTHV